MNAASEPTDVVARVAAILGPLEGDFAPLSGGITNRNFRARFGGRDYVLRLAGKDTELLGIDREAERLANSRASELGIAPKVAAAIDSPYCLVTHFVPGRELTAAELREPDTLAEVARGLRRFHDCGLELRKSFAVLHVVEELAETARARGVAKPSELAAALDLAREIESALSGQADHRPVACHNDLLSANFLHDGERVRIVDWEYAGMGDRFFDLGNLAVNNELEAEDEERLLSAYFGGPPPPRRRAALGLFRYLSDFREAMWGLVQTAVSDLDFDFAAYSRRHFERMESASSDAGFRALIAQAAGSAGRAAMPSTEARGAPD